MYIGLAFWILMLLWAILSVAWRVDIPGGRLGIASNVFIWILFFLLGWAEFGFVLHG